MIALKGNYGHHDSTGKNFTILDKSKQRKKVVDRKNCISYSSLDSHIGTPYLMHASIPSGKMIALKGKYTVKNVHYPNTLICNRF